MTTYTSLHRTVAVRAVDLGGSSNLKLADKDGSEVTVFMEYERAVAMAEAWEDFDRDPEPLDPETVAAREHAHDAALVDAPHDQMEDAS